MRELNYKGRKYWAEFHPEYDYLDSYYMFQDDQGKDIEDQGLIYALEKEIEGFLYEDWFESKIDAADSMSEDR